MDSRLLSRETEEREKLGLNSRGGVLRRGNSRGIKTPVAYSYPANLPSCPMTTLHAQHLRVEYSPQAIIALRKITSSSPPASEKSLVPSRETTILMNFLKLTSYDVKIGSIDSYNEHSCENSLSYIKFGPWEYIRPSMSKTKKNAKLPFLRKMHLKKKKV